MSKPEPIENNPKDPPVIDIEAMASAMKAKMDEAAKADNDANAQDVALTSSKPLTYFNTKSGPFYAKAKEILQTGDFEAVLSKIETGITTILSLLPSQDDLHESLAPLYYMYGTTLLYSIEESQDTAEASVMAQGGDEAAGDLQIAWENLESARNVLTKLSCDSDNEQERVLDLAQIESRLADLSRHNGHYDQAIQDYESCCESRRGILQGDQVWDRRIADVEYSLGMTSLLLAAEGEKNLLNQEEEQEGGKKNEQTNALLAAMAAAGAAAEPDPNEAEKVNLSPEEISALREKSIRHYVQCARILAGIIATMSGANPTETAAADDSLENHENKKMAATKEASKSSTSASVSVQEQASKALSAIRDRVSKLKPTQSSDDDTVHDLREMMDEIQETIDNCEQDREGLRDVNKMRKKAEDDIKKADGVEGESGRSTTGDANAGTTTIGFGSVTKDGKEATDASSSTPIGFGTATVDSGDAGATTIGFGTASSTVASASAPMLVVKKKKKKAATLDNTQDSKRAKTE